MKRKALQLVCNNVLVVSIALAFLSLSGGCKKDNPLAVPDLGHEYFPLRTGQWIQYDADSIVHDDFTGQTDTFVFQLKEIITEDYTDNAGQKAYRVERYTRANDTLPWEIKNVWVANRSASTAERTESNQRFVKLTFPVKKNKSWNGNSYNTLSAWDYKYSSADQPALIGGLAFDSVLTVLQIDDWNIIEEYYAEERYAKHVGLVYKKYRHLNKEVTQQIISGVEYTLTVKSYGN